MYEIGGMAKKRGVSGDSARDISCWILKDRSSSVLKPTTDISQSLRNVGKDKST